MKNPLAKQRKSCSPISHPFYQLLLARQIPQLLCQYIWEMRQHMPDNGRMSGKSHVYLHRSGKETFLVARGSGKMAIQKQMELGNNAPLVERLKRLPLPVCTVRDNVSDTWEREMKGRDQGLFVDRALE